MMGDDGEIALLVPDEGTTVVIDYTNHRGERARRKVAPQTLWWGSTEWHPEPGLILTAYDIERRALRGFAVKDIHGVERADRV